MSKLIIKCERCNQKFDHFITHKVATNHKKFCDDCIADKKRTDNRNAFRLKRMKQQNLT